MREQRLPSSAGSRMLLPFRGNGRSPGARTNWLSQTMLEWVALALGLEWKTGDQEWYW